MSCLKTWEIKCLKKGDTFKAKVLTFPFDITGKSFLMQFRKAEIGPNENPVAFEWSTADGTFEISSPTTLLMKKKLIDVESSLYISDLQMILADGDKETLFNAKIVIEEDYSRVL